MVSVAATARRGNIIEYYGEVVAGTGPTPACPPQEGGLGYRGSSRLQGIYILLHFLSVLIYFFSYFSLY